VVDLKRAISTIKKNWMDFLAVLAIIVSLFSTSAAFSTPALIYAVMAALFAVIGIALLFIPIGRSKGKDILRTGPLSRVIICVALFTVLAGAFLISADIASLGFGAFLIGFVLMVLS